MTTQIEMIGWLVFLERIVDHIAWPGSIFAIALIFRAQIVRAFSRLKSIRHNETEVTFSELLDEASQEASTLPAIEGTVAKIEGLDRKLVKDYPHLAITESWRRIENRVAMIVATEWPRLPEREFHGPSGVRNLRKLEVVDDGVLRLIDDLRKVRNEAVHSWDGDITEGQAFEFVSLAARVERELDAALKKVPKK